MSRRDDGPPRPKPTRHHPPRGWRATLDERDRWKLSLLRAFVRRHGLAAVKKDTVVPPGVRIGTWLHTCRARFRRGTIPDWLVTELERIPGFAWRPYEAIHRQRLDELRAVVRRGGLRRLGNRGGLGAWVMHRRAEHARGELAPWLVRALEAIPGWSWRPHDDAHRRALAHLRAIAATTGSVDGVLRSSVHEGFAIGAWVATIRSEQRRRGRVPAWLRRELERLPGWSWNPAVTRRTAAAQRRRALVRLAGGEEALRGLAMWIATCRRRHRLGTLPPAVAAICESVPGWSWRDAQDPPRPARTPGRPGRAGRSPTGSRIARTRGPS